MFIKRNTIIISNSDYIYFAKIFGNKLEIIELIDSNSIVFISLEEKCFFCNREKINEDKSDNSKNDDEDIKLD